MVNWSSFLRGASAGVATHELFLSLTNGENSNHPRAARSRSVACESANVVLNMCYDVENVHHFLEASIGG